MAPTRSSKPVTVARIKTAAVQGSVRQAEAELRESNEQLADTEVGTVLTKEAMDAALVQNLHVEGQLHEAVKELQVVKELLKTAEQERASPGAEGTAVPGQRSGEGVGSVLEHMASTLETKDDAR
jgi:uncharacterized protein YPO0396